MRPGFSYNVVLGGVAQRAGYGDVAAVGRLGALNGQVGVDGLPRRVILFFSFSVFTVFSLLQVITISATTRDSR